MENMSNIGNLFALSHDPVVCAENKIITYMNPAAMNLFGRDKLGLHESCLLPSNLLEITTDTFVASAKIQDRIITVSRTTYQNQHLYSFILPNPNENDTAINAVASALRELTNGIKMTSDLVNNFSSQYEDRRLHQYTAILNHYTAKMKRLVNNYALFSAFKQNAQPFNPYMTSIKNICTEICKEVELYTLPHNIRLIYKDIEDVVASVDAPLISQMLLNIISNSLNHMPNGGTIILNCTHTKNYITISVEDNGTGIPAELLVNVFKSYAQQEELSSGNFSAGLGLSVADAVAKLHGGTLIIESKENEGTKVIAQIPRVVDTRLMSPKAEYRVPMKEFIMTDLSTWLTWENYLPEQKEAQ